MSRGRSADIIRDSVIILGRGNCSKQYHGRAGNTRRADMILQSRKWRLLLRMVTLVITSTLMLAFAAPASYALQDDRPKLITPANQLFDKQKPIAETYVYTSALPDLAHIVTTRGIGTTYYWI